MTGKNILLTTMLILTTTLSAAFVNQYYAFAESEQSEYKMIGDVSSILTFTFRDGMETIEFPVFKMGENFVTNSGTTFLVEGTVTNSPLLYEAMDEAYQYRLVSGNGYEYPFKLFDVDADFVKDGELVRSLDYSNCRINDYQVETLDSNDYESYFKEVGFAVVDKIEFHCSGVDFENDVILKSTSTSFTDFGISGFKSANNVTTSVTFSFDHGMEKIEFPVFELVSGYNESSEVVTPEFVVEGILDSYPLLYHAIDNSRKVSGISKAANTDFDALVEFTNGQTVLRGFDFRDCRVSDAKITTQTDKEEGFTGKSGFAIVHQLGFACSGLTPINMYYDDLKGDGPIWKMSHMTSMYEEPIQNSDKNLKIAAEFVYPDGRETIEFSMFKQSNVLTTTEDVFLSEGSNPNNDSFDRKASYPTFELRGIVGDYPMLYKSVDDNREIHHISGFQSKSLVDVSVNIMNDSEVIRSFDYSHCRPTDYVVATETNNEESYVKDKFALVNIFDFECQGYHPNNPVYHAMQNSYDRANTLSTNDLRNTDQWPPGFFME